MKNLTRLLGIIAIGAIMGFSLAGCGDDGSGDPSSPSGGNNPGGNDNPGGNNPGGGKNPGGNNPGGSDNPGGNNPGSGSDITIILETNQGYGWQKTYEPASLLNGAKITQGDEFTFTYSFKSNVAMDYLQIVLVDNCAATGYAWTTLSGYVKVKEGITANTVYSGTVTISATGTATDATTLANRLVFQAGTGTTSQPTLTFTALTLSKGSGGNNPGGGDNPGGSNPGGGDNPGGSNPGTGDVAVTFSSVTANGSASLTTSQLTLTFSQAITGLSANDITLSGVSVSKGTLSGSGPTYTLSISNVTSGGTLNVAVSKTGYTISGSPKTATIYYYSAPVVQPPAAPTGVTASAGYTAYYFQVNVSWSAVSGATGYIIYRSTSASSGFTQVDTTTSTSYTNTNLNASTTYYYRVAATNSGGTGAQSSSVPATTSAKVALGTPTNVQGTAGGTFIQISCSPVSLASTYELYRATSATGTYSKVTATVGSTSSSVILTYQNPPTGTAYYKIKAIPSTSTPVLTESALSDYVSVTK